MSGLNGLAGAWLRRRSPARRVVAWVLAIVAPVAGTLALIPWRSSLALGAVLTCMLLVVVVVAALGGVWPAFTAIAISAAGGALSYERLAVSDLGGGLVSLIGFVLVGAVVALLIRELIQLADVQASSARVEAALRRVATLVARGPPADELFATVSEEIGRLLQASQTTMVRYDSDGMVTAVGGWLTKGDLVTVGSRRKLGGNNLTTIVAQTRRPARIDSYADTSGPVAAYAREVGFHSAVGAPIIVEGRLWGVMLAASIDEQPLAADAEMRLASFTELIATAIANAEALARITRLAEEQAALRGIATLVARGAPAEEVFAAVPEASGKLLGADHTSLHRYESDGTATAFADWTRTSGILVAPGRLTLGGTNLATVVSQTHQAARIDSYADASGQFGEAGREAGFRSAVGAPISVQGRLWGVLIAASTSEQPMAPDTEARLASFTELVATAIANAENLAALTASRARVVAAADETRRRIERDLHDGAQQRLVSLGLQLRAAQMAVPPQAGALEGELAQVADGLEGVLEDLQEMARGIHPAILARGGLGSALRTLARRSSVPVELNVQAAVRLPERVEVAAYYVVAEALTNAAKHAHASVVLVDADAADQSLRLCVRDDGTGGADPTRGTGLIGLIDRVEALGGTVTVQSPAGEGTSLTVELPLPGR